MPVSSEDSLSENVYIEMPESVEVLARSVPYNNGVKRNYPENFPDMHLEPKQRTDDIVQPTWRDAFDGKWPYTTPLFYKSEEETLSKLQEQTRNLEHIQRSSTSLESSQWESSIHDIWSGSRRTVNEAFEVDSSDQSEVNKPKGCEKTCRRFLCVFLGLSILGAILAGVGLTLILTSYRPDNQSLYRQGDLIDPGLSIQEKQYLTQTFCNLAKLMLKGTDFPTDSGIASCRTALRLIKESESLQIELLISPEKGFTIKEKFRRALKEEILAEGAYRINGSDTCLYAGDVRNHITCKEAHSNDRDAGLLLDTASADSNEIKSTVSTKLYERNTNDRPRTKQVVEKKKSDIQKPKHKTKVKDSETGLSLNTGGDASRATHKSTTKRTKVMEPKVNENINYVSTGSSQNLIQSSTSVYSSTELKDSSSTPLEPSYSEVYETTRPSSIKNSKSKIAVSMEYDSEVIIPFESSVTPDYSNSKMTDIYDQSSIHNGFRIGDVSSAMSINLDPSTGTTDLPSSEWKPQSSNIGSTETLQYNRTSEYEDNIPAKTFDLNFKANEVVTHKKEFETQTKHNTVATLNSVQETRAAVLGKTIERKTTESVIDTAVINKLLNAKQSFDTTTSPTVTVALNDMSNELSALGDTDLLFRLNLYGTSKSKNYLRFPIVTGSNGKFLFSPLSNKDTIDIAAKPNVSEGKVDNQTKQGQNIKTVTKIVTVNATNETGNIETTKQKTVLTEKVKPKPMIVDWKTPPAAKPTNFPKGWESRDIMFNANIEKRDTAGSKLSFSVPRLNQANFF